MRYLGFTHGGGLRGNPNSGANINADRHAIYGDPWNASNYGMESGAAVLPEVDKPATAPGDARIVDTCGIIRLHGAGCGVYTSGIMEPTVILLIVGAVVLFGGIFVLARHFDKKRTAELQAEAQAMGLEFCLHGGDISPAGLSQFDLFSRGHGKRVKNAMIGRLGHAEVAVFDYRYVTGHGKHRHTHAQSVVMFDAPGLDLPSFLAKPENIFHKIGSAFGYQDIDFVEHPEFSKRFLLRGPDEQAIRQVFTDEALTHFEMNRGVCVEARGTRMLFYRASKSVKPFNIRGLVDEARDVLSLFRKQA